MTTWIYFILYVLGMFPYYLVWVFPLNPSQDWMYYILIPLVLWIQYEVYKAYYKLLNIIFNGENIR